MRCLSPERVCQEVWAHLLAYNLLRGLMARAAEEAGLLPLPVRFQGALQAVPGWAAVRWTAAVEELAARRGRLREAIASQGVGDGPNRGEARAGKGRAKHERLLNESRQDARVRWGVGSWG